MAISGVTATDVDNLAKDLGIAKTGRYSAAHYLGGYAYKTKTCTSADSTAHVCTLTFTNQEGIAVIDWGDGTVVQVDASAGTAAHTYGSAGTKTWDFTASGFHKRATQALA